MKYMGSKNRIAKEIIPIFEKYRKDGQIYVEPFVGGANMIDKIDGERIGFDKNQYLISMLNDLKNGIKFPQSEEITKEIYDYCRDIYHGREDLNELTLGYVGWVGFMASANGRFFDGGWSGKSVTKTGKVRDYIAESIRNIEKQLPLLIDIEFICDDYINVDNYIPNNSFIYCDPPYQNTKQYGVSKDFDYEKFWNWVRNMSKKHTILVSEYNAPIDFKCVWSRGLKSSLRANSEISGYKKSVEKLFIYNGE